MERIELTRENVVTLFPDVPLDAWHWGRLGVILLMRCVH